MNRILVVNDEESIRILYSEELLEEGYEVTATGRGSQVTGLITETRPNLVLLDIRWGREDGLHTLQDIKECCRDLPVLICTDDPRAQCRMMPESTDCCVVKGSRMTELKHRIKMVLEGGGQSLSASGLAKGPGQGSGYMGQMGFPWRTDH